MTGVQTCALPIWKIWEVYVDGKVIQLVGATDNRKATAERYIASKYPNVQFTLKFLEYRI